MYTKLFQIVVKCHLYFFIFIILKYLDNLPILYFVKNKLSIYKVEK